MLSEASDTHSQTDYVRMVLRICLLLMLISNYYVCIYEHVYANPHATSSKLALLSNKSSSIILDWCLTLLASESDQTCCVGCLLL